jgi:hypothetical protein
MIADDGQHGERTKTVDVGTVLRMLQMCGKAIP